MSGTKYKSLLKVTFSDNENIYKKEEANTNDKSNNISFHEKRKKYSNKKDIYLNKKNLNKRKILIEDDKKPLFKIEKLEFDNYINEKNKNDKEILSILNENFDEINGYIFFSKYQLGKGSFGNVYYGMDNKYENDFAIKVQYYKNNDLETFKNELTFLGILKNEIGFPQVFYNHQNAIEKRFILVESLLGPSLDKLLKFCNKQFKLQTICYIGIEMIERLETLHKNSILHRDIKPNNFIWGNYSRKKKSKKNFNNIFLIDFGLSCFYIIKNQHYELSTGNSFIGTLRYASINTHKGIRESRRDDLESVMYVLIYLFKGCLPWQGIKAKTKPERQILIKEKKLSVTTEELCKGLPKEFIYMINNIKDLRFEEKPNYELFKYNFKKILNSLEKENKYSDKDLNSRKYKYEWENLMINGNHKNEVINLFEGYPFDYNQYVNDIKKNYNIN